MAHARHRSISCLVLIKLRRVYSRSKKTVKSEFYFAIRTCERALSLALPIGMRAGAAPRAPHWHASGLRPSRSPLACERAPPLALPAGGAARPRAPCKKRDRLADARCHAHLILVHAGHDRGRRSCHKLGLPEGRGGEAPRDKDRGARRSAPQEIERRSARIARATQA